jgi:hypothetical protein
MSVKGKDREFRTPKTTYLDFKFIEMDRVLTMLFPRLRFDGYSNRFKRGNKLITIEEFVEEFLEQKESFKGFSDFPEVTRRWVETDLLDLVNRGKANQAVAAPRPLHGNIYKFRNAKHTRDYFASDQLYWMLFFARRGKGQAARDELKRFFFKGYDFNTDKYEDLNSNIDVETQALLSLDAIKDPIKDSKSSEEPCRVQPVCIGEADILADDILRLLAYENYIPRSVLVDYLKTVMAFHLAIYHLRLLQIIPNMVKQRARHDLCCAKECPTDPSQDDALGVCPHTLGLVIDMGDVGNERMAELAGKSTNHFYRQIPNFVQANFIVKKLDEMVEYLCKNGKLSDGDWPAGELVSLLNKKYNSEREPYFKSRLASLIEESNSGEDDYSPEISKIREMKNLGEFEKFIEILMIDRGEYNQKYIIQCLDSLLLKNKENGLLSQSRMRPRRFVLSSKLLETLLQVAVLTQNEGNFVTREIRIEELLAFLRNRYGLYIDRLPEGKRESADILDRRALRLNLDSFKRRLREIGFYEDLSDAYVTQKISPRYMIESKGEANRTGRRK